MIKKLDDVFKSQQTDEAYNIYSNFIKFRKSSSMSMAEYISEYEHLYSEMVEYKMKLPENVIAFILLDGANITEDERNLVLTLANHITFENTKSALKRLFSGTRELQSSGNSMSNIKQEEAFYNESKRGNKVKFKQEKNVMNPRDKNGKISRCVICDSKMHWAKNCPHKKLQNINMTETNSDEDNYENANIVLMTEQASENEIC